MLHDPAARLPVLIDRARSRLAEARTSAEALEARALADAALHLARTAKAAMETHADCLRIVEGLLTDLRRRSPG